MKKLAAVLIAMMTTSLCLQARLVTYPAGEGLDLKEDYSVRVREYPAGEWYDVAVYPVKVDEVKEAAHSVKTVSMAYFDFDEKVEVEVVPRHVKPETVRIRPLSYSIEPSCQSDTVRFVLSEPRNLSIEVNGDIFNNLHLFANPIDKHRPTAKEIKKRKDLIYFAPGLHRLPGDTLLVHSNTTVYVDGGARVMGTLIINDADNVKVYGRGEVHPEGRGFGVEVKRSKDVEVDGIIVTQLPIGGSDGVNVTNVKAISSYGWGDGMNIFASYNVLYDGVFCRNSDDCSTVYATRKGYAGGCENIVMKNSTLWADVAHPIMIGLHGSAKEIGIDAPADTIRNILYENIDILDHAERQLDYQGCMAINCGDNNVVDGITFDNIRVEDFRQGQLLNVRIFFNKKYCAAPGSCIKNVLFKDIKYDGGNSELSIVEGYDQDHKVENIVFDNLKINGVHIHDDMPGKPKWYKTGDLGRIFVGEHVEGVEFR